jgi:predicted lipoprotein with Yx(FWY)xxD motif
MRHFVLLTLATAALAAAGCGSDDDDSTEQGAAAQDAPAETTMARSETPMKKPAGANMAEKSDGPRTRGTRIKLGSSQYGRVLFDGSGQAIYLFDKERSARSRCYGQCAEEWPPVLTKGRPRAGRGIDRRLLSTIRRRGGPTQVTYDGHPLYLYAHEGKNEVRCHNVPGFGGIWLALDRRGDPA